MVHDNVEDDEMRNRKSQGTNLGVLDLCCPVQEPTSTCGYRAPEMWLV